MKKCMIILKLEVFKSKEELLRKAKMWEELNNYRYSNDNELIRDYVLAEKNYIHAESPQILDAYYINQ